MLTFPLLLAGLLWATWHGGLSSLAEAAGACVLLALPYVFLFVFANGGAGDAKLMGAIGAWLGFKQGIIVLCCVATAGIILAIMKSLMQRQAKAVCTSVFVTMYTFMLSLAGHKMQLINNLADSEQSESIEVPYGVAIFTGVIVAGVIIWYL
jgi:prepilin peptidase CpaA